MKKIIFSIISIAILFSMNACNSKSAKNDNKTESSTVITNNADANKIQVYYFHGSIRCHTCVSVDEDTHEYLKEMYTEEFNNDKISFHSIDIDKIEREDLIKKYEIYGQTLLLTKGDRVINETDDAFQYVTTNPEKWKQILKTKMDSLLN